MPDFMGRRLLRDPGPAPYVDDSPRDEFEGPEVWCARCEWWHPRGAAHLYGKCSESIGGR